LNQLIWCTDARGEVSPQKTEEFRFGPYLSELPEEPVTGSTLVTIDTQGERSLPSLAAAVAGGPGEGGWYYEARTGNLVANLGADFGTKYPRY
jgi:hypothetical protein